MTSMKETIHSLQYQVLSWSWSISFLFIYLILINSTEGNDTVSIVSINDESKIQYHNANFHQGNYNYGYDIQPPGPSGQFHHEIKAPDQIVYGCYGFINAFEVPQITFYISDAWGYRTVKNGRNVEIFYPSENPEGTQDMKGTQVPFQQLGFPQGCSSIPEEFNSKNNLVIRGQEGQGGIEVNENIRTFPLDESFPPNSPTSNNQRPSGAKTKFPHQQPQRAFIEPQPILTSNNNDGPFRTDQNTFNGDHRKNPPFIPERINLNNQDLKIPNGGLNGAIPSNSPNLDLNRNNEMRLTNTQDQLFPRLPQSNQQQDNYEINEELNGPIQPDSQGILSSENPNLNSHPQTHLNNNRSPIPTTGYPSSSEEIAHLELGNGKGSISDQIIYEFESKGLTGNEGNMRQLNPNMKEPFKNKQTRDQLHSKDQNFDGPGSEISEEKTNGSFPIQNSYTDGNKNPRGQNENSRGQNENSRGQNENSRIQNEYSQSQNGNHDSETGMKVLLPHVETERIESSIETEELLRNHNDQTRVPNSAQFQVVHESSENLRDPLNHESLNEKSNYGFTLNEGTPGLNMGMNISNGNGPANSGKGQNVNHHTEGVRRKAFAPANNEEEESCISSCRNPSRFKNKEEIDYSKIPGAIVKNVNVIFYPDCDSNAFSRPAVVPFCSTGPSLTMKFPSLNTRPVKRESQPKRKIRRVSFIRKGNESATN